MTTQEKLVKRKLTLIELAEFLKNVSQACKIHGVSRQHFYDIKKVYDEHGIEGLKEKTRRKPCIKNRVAPEVEQAVLKMAYEYPAYGQLRVANELRKSGILVSSGGVRSIWLRHDLQTFKKRLSALEQRAAKEGIVYTEAQLAALESAKQKRESDPDEIETQHPGYLIAQDTGADSVRRDRPTHRPARFPSSRHALGDLRRVARTIKDLLCLWGRGTFPDQQHPTRYLAQEQYGDFQFRPQARLPGKRAPHQRTWLPLQRNPQCGNLRDHQSGQLPSCTEKSCL